MKSNTINIEYDQFVIDLRSYLHNKELSLIPDIAKAFLEPKKLHDFVLKMYRDLYKRDDITDVALLSSIVVLVVDDTKGDYMNEKS